MWSEIVILIDCILYCLLTMPGFTLYEKLFFTDSLHVFCIALLKDFTLFRPFYWNALQQNWFLSEKNSYAKIHNPSIVWKTLWRSALRLEVQSLQRVYLSWRQDLPEYWGLHDVVIVPVRTSSVVENNYFSYLIFSVLHIAWTFHPVKHSCFMIPFIRSATALSVEL